MKTTDMIKSLIFHSILEVSRDVAAHSVHETLVRCDIGAKLVKCSGIEYMNLRLVINTHNILIEMRLNKGSY
jgi:hypothetical protein